MLLGRSGVEIFAPRLTWDQVDGIGEARMPLTNHVSELRDCEAADRMIFSRSVITSLVDLLTVRCRVVFPTIIF